MEGVTGAAGALTSGTDDEVICNGRNAEQNDLDMYWGKGLVSRKVYDAAYDACGFSGPGTKAAAKGLAPMPEDRSFSGGASATGASALVICRNDSER